jgi:hypothetical protein
MPSTPKHPNVDSRERAYLGSADDSTEAWDLAEEFAKLLKTLGVSPDTWRIGVRQVTRTMHVVEAIRQENSDDTQK